MPSHLADDTEIKTEPPGEEDALAGFQDILDGVEQSPDNADEEVTEEPEQPETDEVESQPEPKVTRVEGPTPAMKAWAEQSGLPPQLVAAARDDEQLEEFIQLARSSSPPEEEPQDNSAFQLSLPEDEFPENDPVRREFSKLQSHFAEQVSSLKQQLAETQQKSQSFEKKFSAQAEQEARQTQVTFDHTLDEMGLAALGKSESLSDANFALRRAAYELVATKRQQNPSASIADLAKQAIAEMQLNPKTPQQKQQIRKQAESRLGAGPASPANPGAKSQVEEFQAYLDSLK